MTGAVRVQPARLPTGPLPAPLPALPPKCKLEVEHTDSPCRWPFLLVMLGGQRSTARGQESASPACDEELETAFAGLFTSRLETVSVTMDLETLLSPKNRRPDTNSVASLGNRDVPGSEPLAHPPGRGKARPSAAWAISCLGLGLWSLWAPFFPLSAPPG